MPLRLDLIRHGEAVPHSPDGDASRALTAAGIRAVRRLGERFADEGWRPDLVLASPYERAQETALLLVQVTGTAPTLLPLADPIPDRGPEDLAQAVARLADGLAHVVAALSRGPDYDQGTAKEAKQKFEDFVKEYPDAVLSVDAQKNIETLNERESQHLFETARFYEKQKQYKAALVNYNDIINRYPGSEWAVTALERVQALKEKE